MTRSLNFIEQNWINSTHVQKQSAVVNMKESVTNDTAVLFTTKNNVDSIDNATSTYVQKQSAIVNMKENDANDTIILFTTKNNVDLIDNAAKSDKFMKNVHSQQTDKSEDFTNKIHMLLYYSQKRSRFNHLKKNTTSIILADQTLHYSKSLKYVYKQQINDKWFLQRMMKVLNHCIQSDESWMTRCKFKKMTC